MLRPRDLKSLPGSLAFCCAPGTGYTTRRKLVILRCMQNRVERVSRGNSGASKLSVLMALFIAIPVWSQIPEVSKKVISFSGQPTARMFHADVREMETLMPVVDGVTIYPTTYKNNVSTEAVGRIFRKDFHRLEDFDTGIGHMLSADARLYRENFLHVYLTSGVIDMEVPNWFDPEFDAVINNWRVAAVYANRAGMVGLLFDNEAYYGKNLWSYGRINHLDPRPAQEYYDQAFLRGAQIMRAVSEVYPDIKILVLLGPVHTRVKSSGHDPAGRFELMRAFFDGLLSECTGESAIIEGAGKAYKFKHASQFEKVADAFRTEARALSRVPEAFERHARIAFPIYLGGGSNYPETTHFNIEDFSTNYYSPEELSTALRGALEHTDEYVWIYTEHVSLWRRSHLKFLPEEYRDAMLAAHDPRRALLTAIEDERSGALPQENALLQNYPNPFNSITVIRFTLRTPQDVELSVYNLAGQKAITLVDGPHQAGSHTIDWDGRNSLGRQLGTGVYLYRVRTDEWDRTRRLLLLR